MGSDPEDAQRIGGDAPMIGSTVASRKREPCSALRRSCSTLRRTSPVKGEGIDFYETVKLMKAQRRALFLDRDLCWSETRKRISRPVSRPAWGATCCTVRGDTRKSAREFWSGTASWRSEISSPARPVSNSEGSNRCGRLIEHGSSD